MSSCIDLMAPIYKDISVSMLDGCWCQVLQNRYKIGVGVWIQDGIIWMLMQLFLLEDTGTLFDVRTVGLKRPTCNQTEI